MTERAGSVWPLHPDQYGHPLGRNLGLPEVDDEFLYAEEPMEPLTDDEVGEMWTQELESRRPAPLHQHGGCGHKCTDNGCYVFGGMKDFLCPTCDIAAERQAREWRRKGA